MHKVNQVVQKHCKYYLGHSANTINIATTTNNNEVDYSTKQLNVNNIAMKLHVL